jgi:ornithine--oxo-acid transaminase
VEAEIIVCADNFHGRTLGVIGFSTDAAAREHFGPFAPGFRIIPFGNAKALEEAITPNTVAFLVEPIQGEAGVIIPPPGYFGKVRALCTAHDVMLILDEIQSGLGRTGKLLAEQHDGIEADVTLLVKALSGGFYPVSAVLSNNAVLGTLKPGQHGSTFGGNPLACAVARAALRACRGGDDRERGRPRRALPRWPKEHPCQHDPRGARTRIDVGGRASPGSRRRTSLL